MHYMRSFCDKFSESSEAQLALCVGGPVFDSRRHACSSPGQKCEAQRLVLVRSGLGSLVPGNSVEQGEASVSFGEDLTRPVKRSAGPTDDHGANGRGRGRGGPG
jgi:hypothetical protein